MSRENFMTPKSMNQCNFEHDYQTNHTKSYIKYGTAYSLYSSYSQ